MASPRRGNPRIPGWILFDVAQAFKLTAAERAVLIQFAAQERDGITFLTDALMQEYTGLSRPTIQRARPKLVKLGLLEEVTKGARHGHVARYRIPESMPSPPATMIPPTRGADHDGAGWIARPEDASF